MNEKMRLEKYEGTARKVWALWWATRIAVAAFLIARLASLHTVTGGALAQVALEFVVVRQLLEEAARLAQTAIYAKSVREDGEP